MNEVKNKFHPWRVCAKGFCYRGGTTETIKSESQNLPSITLGRDIWKCVSSKSKKDVLHTEEIIVISSVFFPYLQGPPNPKSLGFKDGSKFDSLIRGWTKYWNDILQPTEALDANLVKALIGSESSFNVNPKQTADAKGLMQIRESSRKALGNLTGELKNRFVVFDKSYVLDPSTNICGGIRWLFRKRDLAKSKLKRQATWEEAVAEYKSYLKGYQKNPDHRGMEKFRDLYKKLSG